MQISCCSESKKERCLVWKEGSDGRRTFLDPLWKLGSQLGQRKKQIWVMLEAMAAPAGSSRL